jgi:hypothetical protein
MRAPGFFISKRKIFGDYEHPGRLGENQAAEGAEAR